jgi:hypothetical protein
MNKLLHFLQKISGKYSDAKYFTVSWFVRLAWAPCMAWGVYDMLLDKFGKDTSSENAFNADIRIITGFILFLIWYFLLRPADKRKREQGK